METYQVDDESHWFTQEQVDRFYEKTVQLTGNKDIARDAGRYAASPGTIGLMRQYVLGYVGPAKAYEMVGKYASNFSKSCVYKSSNRKSNKVEITVTPKPGVQEKPYQCENRIGYFEAIALLFRYQRPKINHTKCMFRGDDSCCYEVTWKKSHSSSIRKIRDVSIVLLVLLFMLMPLFMPSFRPIDFALVSIIVVFGLHSTYFYLENRELKKAIANLWDSTDSLLKTSEENYKNALLVNDIGLALSKQQNIKGILSEVVEVMRNNLDYDRCMILLANRDKTKLVYYAGYGYDNSQANVLKYATFNLVAPQSTGAFVNCFKEQKPILVNDIDDIHNTLTPHSLEFARNMGVKSFICCPIVDEGQSLGLLAVDNVRTKRPLLQKDINLLMGISPAIGICINNALLTQAYEVQFKSVIKVLGASIDARDPLTAGHSEKVTEYSMGICQEMGLPRDFSEMIRVAALLHDYGKIGVSDMTLKKNGTLTPKEFAEIQTHVTKTQRILEKVNFEGIYRDVPRIVGCHHEKMDGSGYPYGLRSDQIPMGARIIAVADFFDAITSKRHYRDPMPVPEAVDLLKEMSPHQFDQDVVNAFMRYYNRVSGGMLDYYFISESIKN